ncbi:MAG TPA: chemotaxis protein CheW [Solirubrobacterales bacterium]|nr:chemotaxis protein CheW [Solirubrobacterales bacterium]
MSGVHVRVRVAGEHYALPVEQVLEVADLGEIAPVPGSPPEIAGVRNLRGQVIPVIGLATMLGLSGDEPSRVVVAESGELRAGLVVDEVLDVGELPPASEQVESNYLLGACLADGELVGVLDVEAVLASIGSRGASA